MKKIKIFLNHIKEVPEYLNKMSDKGYRLKTVNHCVFEFEKSDKKYYYGIQFIGYNPNKENTNYINFLKDSECRTFRIPLNQLNFAFGKLRFRPFAKGSAKLSTSFDNYNKEFLIVESLDKHVVHLLTDPSDLHLMYTQLKNAYLQGLVMLLFLFGIMFYHAINHDIKGIHYVLAAILFIAFILFGHLYIHAFRKAKCIHKESTFME